MRLLILVLSCVLWCNAAVAAGKVALVIGNGAYQNANTLPNPPNDATDMAAMLQSLGFTVISGTDLDHEAMVERISAFEEATQNADTALFFYAGHGMQVDGQNYLIPVNAKLERKSSLQFEAINSEVVYRAMSAPGRTAIVFLDACRDSPLSRRFASIAKATRSTVVASGLATPSTAEGGLFIGFATKPDDVAADGEGRNSPFTTALLKFMPTPGLEIQQMMTKVKASVYESTHETQEPWHNTSLRTEVYLGGTLNAAPEATVQKQSIPLPASSIDVEWNAVKDSGSAVVLDAFIAAHADSPVFVALAENRKAQINQQSAETVLDNLKIPDDAQQPTAHKGVSLQALNNLKQPLIETQEKTPVQRSSSWTLDGFFELGKSANDGQAIYALLSAPTVDLTVPVKNPGPKNQGFAVRQITSEPSLDALMAAKPDLGFAAEQVTSCRLDWIDRCPFVPDAMVQGLAAALQAKGQDMLNHDGNYYMLSRIASSNDYLLSNAPQFRDGKVAVIAAIVTAELQVREVYGFDLSRSKLKLEAGAPEAIVEITGAAMDGDNLYLSFDGSQRCTDKPRRYGFIAKFSRSDRSVKWVSPLNVSDANLLLSNGRLFSANGGSCTEDYLYDIDTKSGSIIGRAKLPSAVERMDLRDGRLILELYDQASVYQLP
jgi:Caspase domain